VLALRSTEHIAARVGCHVVETGRTGARPGRPRACRPLRANRLASATALHPGLVLPVRAIRREQAAVACLHLCSSEPLSSGVGDGDAGRRAGRRGAGPSGGRVVVLPRPFSWHRRGGHRSLPRRLPDCPRRRRRGGSHQPGFEFATWRPTQCAMPSARQDQASARSSTPSCTLWSSRQTGPDAGLRLSRFRSRLGYRYADGPAFDKR